MMLLAENSLLPKSLTTVTKNMHERDANYLLSEVVRLDYLISSSSPP